MTFKMQKRKHYYLSMIAYPFIMVYMLSIVGVHGTGLIVGLIAFGFGSYMLVYNQESTLLTVGEDALIYKQARGEVVFPYSTIRSSECVKSRMINIISTTMAIKLMYEKDGKLQPFQFNPEHVDECFAMLQNRIEACDKQ